MSLIKLVLAGFWVNFFGVVYDETKEGNTISAQRLTLLFFFFFFFQFQMDDQILLLISFGVDGIILNISKNLLHKPKSVVLEKSTHLYHPVIPSSTFTQLSLNSHHYILLLLPMTFAMDGIEIKLFFTFGGSCKIPQNYIFLIVSFFL